MSDPKIDNLARQDEEELTAEQAEAAQGGLMSSEEAFPRPTDPRARGGTVIIAD